MGNSFGTWQKVNNVIATSGISVTPSAQELQLADETYMSVWPFPNKPLVTFPMASNGKAVLPSRAVRIGRQNPSWQVKGPVTQTLLALGLTNFCQDENYSSTAYLPRVAGNHGSAIATLFHHFETGMAGSVNGLLKAKGGVVSSYTLDIPAPVDGEPGMPSLSLDYLGASVDDNDGSFTTGTPTVDTGSPLLSTDFFISLDDGGGAANILFVSASITGRNNAKRSPNNEATASYFTIGRYTIDGTIRVVLTDGVGDAFDILNDAHQAETVLTMVIYATANGGHSQTHRIRVGAPQVEPGDNDFIVSFPFQSLYVPGANQPSFSITMSDTINYAS